MKVLTPFRDLNNTRKSRKKKLLKIFLIVFIVLFVVIGLLTFNVLRNVKKVQKSAGILAQSVKQRDFPAIKSNIAIVSKDLKSTRTALMFLKPVSFVPFVGSYYNDAEHLTNVGILGLEASDILVDGIEPYADALGLKEKTQTSEQAQGRIKVLVKALNDLLPFFDRVSPKITTIKAEIDQVNPDRYPQSLFGFRPKEQLVSTKVLVDQVDTLLVDAKPAIAILPEVLGDPKQKNYLILFQNDKEIRPSGGFLTAFTYLKADKGDITTTGSDDIYSLDEQIDRVCRNVICNLTPPVAIVKYLPEPTGKTKQAIESRDSNISPDFKVDSEEFTRFYTISGRQSYDGIIAVDTYLVRDLLAALGPIKVDGYEKPFDKDNVVDALEGYSEVVFAGSTGRKSVLGDLMDSIFFHVLRAPSSQFIPLFETMVSSLDEKHVLLYFKDEKHQKVFEDLGWAGRIVNFDGDYLHINDSNFAGGKAGLFVTEEVDQQIKIDKDGTTTKTVTIKYKNEGKYSARNPGFRDWVRIFVPKGSELISSKGSQNQVLTSQDLGKTVFEAFHTVRPEGTSTLQFEYKLPFKYKQGDYNLLVQKQPGIYGFKYKISINDKNKEEFLLQADKKLELKV